MKWRELKSEGETETEKRERQKKDKEAKKNRWRERKKENSIKRDHPGEKVLIHLIDSSTTDATTKMSLWDQLVMSNKIPNVHMMLSDHSSKTGNTIGTIATAHLKACS